MLDPRTSQVHKPSPQAKLTVQTGSLQLQMAKYANEILCSANSTTDGVSRILASNRACSDYKIVITHGTDTLEETAFFSEHTARHTLDILMSSGPYCQLRQACRHRRRDETVHGYFGRYVPRVLLIQLVLTSQMDPPTSSKPSPPPSRPLPRAEGR
jgi:hypothetical protein